MYHGGRRLVVVKKGRQLARQNVAAANQESQRRLAVEDEVSGLFARNQNGDSRGHRQQRLKLHGPVGRRTDVDVRILEYARKYRARLVACEGEPVEQAEFLCLGAESSFGPSDADDKAHAVVIPPDKFCQALQDGVEGGEVVHVSAGCDRDAVA